jgi:hypothetical protein
MGEQTKSGVRYSLSDKILSLFQIGERERIKKKCYEITKNNKIY